MPVSIVTDSANSLPAEDLERLGIRVVPLYVNEGDVGLPETELDLGSFYTRLVTVATLPTTSQPSPEDFARAFEEIVARGADALAVLISSKMSGTSRVAESGADLARERHPGARIALVDSASNSMQEGFAVQAAAECAALGGDLAACEAAALASVARSRFLFAPRSLDNLSRGGRISAAAALVGSALRIVPILTASDGTTGVAGVVRTRTQAMRRMTALMRRDVERCGLARAVVQVVADFDDAARFAREWVEPIVGHPVPIIPVPASVGVHVGPAIGVAYETVDPLR